MLYLILAILFTSVLYVITTYMSFFAAAILYKGIAFRLIGSVLKSSSFILSCYTSIIADFILFQCGSYTKITVKNGFLLLIVIVALVSASDRSGKET